MSDFFNTTMGDPTAPKRPTLLTVLCIITFLSSGWGFLDSISTYRNADVLSAIASQSMKEASKQVKEDVKDDPQASAFVDKIMDKATTLTDPEKTKKKAVFQMVYSLIALAGAFLMFRLRKVGFWVYVVGAVVTVISPVVVYGANNFLVSIGTTILAFGTLLFVVLYALNLKYMK